MRRIDAMTTKGDEILGEAEMGREEDGEVVVGEVENGRTEETDEVRDACRSVLEAAHRMILPRIDVDMFLCHKQMVREVREVLRKDRPGSPCRSSRVPRTKSSKIA